MITKSYKYIYIYSFKIKYIPYKIHKYFNFKIYFEQFFLIKVLNNIDNLIIFLNYKLL